MPTFKSRIEPSPAGGAMAGQWALYVAENGGSWRFCDWFASPEAAQAVADRLEMRARNWAATRAAWARELAEARRRRAERLAGGEFGYDRSGLYALTLEGLELQRGRDREALCADARRLGPGAQVDEIADAEAGRLPFGFTMTVGWPGGPA